MFHDKFVRDWLMDDDEFEAFLRRLTIVQFVLLGPWGVLMLFEMVIIFIRSVSKIYDSYWDNILLGLLATYPVLAMICLGMAWRIWKKDKAQVAIMKWVWWPPLLFVSVIPFVIDSMEILKFLLAVWWGE